MTENEEVTVMTADTLAADTARIGDGRSRSWTIIIYPESAPEQWREVLDNMHIEWIESPLHDKDVNPDGELKKPHWHLALLFEGIQRYSAIKSIQEQLRGVTPQPIKSVKGLVRYMIHMDNPEKYQYNRDDIVGHGGVDVDAYFEMTMTGRIELLKEISTFIIENEVTSLDAVTQHALTEKPQWFEVIADRNTLFITRLIDSIWKKNHQDYYKNRK